MKYFDRNYLLNCLYLIEMDFKHPTTNYVDPLQVATDSHKMGQSLTDMLNDVTTQQHHDVTKPQQHAVTHQSSGFNQTFDLATANSVCLFFGINISIQHFNYYNKTKIYFNYNCVCCVSSENPKD